MSGPRLTEETTDRAVFARYHRAERLRIARNTVLGLGAAALGLGFFVSTSVVAAPAIAPDGPTEPAAPVAVPRETPSAAPVALPEDLPAATTSAPQVSPPAPPPGPPSSTGWSIVVDTTGYQAELDQCLWVRMDLGAVAPIVGAHRSCRGALVLDLVDGDVVDLAGEGLDGRYLVVGSRDAYAGDTASSATAGMVADVLLQTCYEGAGGRVRLVALVWTESIAA